MRDHSLLLKDIISIWIKKKYSDLPWKEISGMRDRLIHGYFGVDYRIIWKTIEKELPVFKKQIYEILKETINKSH